MVDGGVLLVFIGTLVALVTRVAPPMEQTAVLVYRACSGVLLVMAGISLLTGARTSVLRMKLCPAIFLTVAGLFFVATVL